MAQHECLFDHRLLGECKLPPHDACRCDRTDDGPTIYTLHWYRRLACVIQEDGRVLTMCAQRQDVYDSLVQALPEIVWQLAEK